MMDSPGSIPMETAMEMSLDEYIAAKKQLKVETDSDDYLAFNSLSGGHNRPKPVSNQWRFMQDNGTERPLGMPPLVNIDSGLQAVPAPTTMSRPNEAVQNAGSSAARDIEIQFDNLEYKNGTKSKKWRKKNYRTNNYNQQDSLRGVDHLHTTNFKNRVSVHQRLYNMDRNAQQQNYINLRVPVTVFSNQNKNPNIHNNSQSLVSTAYANQQNRGNFPMNDEFVKNCLELVNMFQKSLKPEQAEKKYDKKLQKEICEIQGKPLMYTGQDFTVVSFDGPGLNLIPKPHTTEISLNQRFA